MSASKLVLAVVVALLGACGDDDDDTHGGEGEGEPADGGHAMRGSAREPMRIWVAVLGLLWIAAAGCGGRSRGADAGPIDVDAAPIGTDSGPTAGCGDGVLSDDEPATEA